MIKPRSPSLAWILFVVMLMCGEKQTSAFVRLHHNNNDHYMMRTLAVRTEVVARIRPSSSNSLLKRKSAISDDSNMRGASSVEPETKVESSSSSPSAAAGTSNGKERTSNNVDAPQYDLPWGSIQKWALRDNIQRYTRQVSVTTTTVTTLRVITLWRTLSKEVTELSGYPIPFLVARYQDLCNENDETDGTIDDVKKTSIPKCSPVVLPYLDAYEFEPNGGLAGRVAGVLGVADGTRIQTTPVGSVHDTIPDGYVITADGAVLYELGEPVQETESIHIPGNVPQQLTQTADAVRRTIDGKVVAAANIKDGQEMANKALDNVDLVQVGAVAAAVAGGGFAMQLLQHHLTVNVFWV